MTLFAAGCSHIQSKALLITEATERLTLRLTLKSLWITAIYSTIT